MQIEPQVEVRCNSRKQKLRLAAFGIEPKMQDAEPQHRKKRQRARTETESCEVTGQLQLTISRLVETCGPSLQVTRKLQRHIFLMQKITKQVKQVMEVSK